MQLSLGVPVTGGRDALEVGYATVPREQVNIAGALAAGSIRFTYFSALTNMTVNSIRTWCGQTGQVGSTLSKVGLYSVAANGDLTKAGECASDLALWSTPATAYTKTLTAPVSLTAGLRYALATLVVGVSTPPTLAAQGVTSFNFGAEAAEAPRVWGLRAGVADLTASITAAQIGNTGQFRIYGVLIP